MPEPGNFARTVLRRNPKAVAGAVALLLIVVAAVMARSGDDGDERQAGTATTTGSAPEPSSTQSTGPAGPSSTVARGGTGTSGPGPTNGPGPSRPVTTVLDDRPEASWASTTVPRAKAPAEWLEAWERARNKAVCGLLAPTGEFPRMAGAEASFDKLTDDQGWDVRLRREAGIVEILGLFPASAQSPESRPAPFTRTWKDGSVAKYGPDVPPEMEEGEVDPETTAYEARVTIPGQECLYQIYDTLGRSHIEFVLGHLAFVEGTR